MLVTVMSERETHGAPARHGIVGRAGLPPGRGDEPVRRGRHRPHLRRRSTTGSAGSLSATRTPTRRRRSRVAPAARRRPRVGGPHRSISSAARATTRTCGSARRCAASIDMCVVATALGEVRSTARHHAQRLAGRGARRAVGSYPVREGCHRDPGVDHHRAVAAGLRLSRTPDVGEWLHGKSDRPDGGIRRPERTAARGATRTINDAQAASTSRADSLASPPTSTTSRPTSASSTRPRSPTRSPRIADEALALLAEHDPGHRRRPARLARRLAGPSVPRSRPPGPGPTRRGIGKVVAMPYQPDRGDLDIDASTEAMSRPPRRPIGRRSGAATGAAVGPAPHRRVPARRPQRVDGRQAPGHHAVAAAAVAFRSPGDFSVVSFAKDAVVVKAQDAPTTIDRSSTACSPSAATARPISPGRARGRRRPAGPIERRPQDHDLALGLPGYRAGRRARSRRRPSRSSPSSPPRATPRPPKNWPTPSAPR